MSQRPPIIFVKTWFLDWLTKCEHKLMESATKNIEKEWD